MTGQPVIGVLGSYGAVGRSAVAALAGHPGVRLRLAGRRAEGLEAQALLLGEAETSLVDLDEPATLARFCEGCSVIINCAGPSYVVLDRVARPALAAGADYVDPGGDDPLLRRLAPLHIERDGRCAVLTAGMMPGLSSLIPRWLAADGFDSVTGLTAYVGTLDHLSPASAADYLLSLASGTHGEAKAAWVDGVRVPAALQALPDAALPFFPGRVSAYPYLSAETDRLAHALRLREVRWFNVFDGTQMLDALGRLAHVELDRPGALATAAATLARAAELDLFGRDPYQLMVFGLDGIDPAGPRTRGLVLRAGSTYELTGAVAAGAALAALSRQVPPGAHFADEVLDPALVPGIVSASRSVSLFERLTEPLELQLAVEEGAL